MNQVKNLMRTKSVIYIYIAFLFKNKIRLLSGIIITHLLMKTNVTVNIMIEKLKLRTIKFTIIFILL